MISSLSSIKTTTCLAIALSSANQFGMTNALLRTGMGMMGMGMGMPCGGCMGGGMMSGMGGMMGMGGIGSLAGGLTGALFSLGDPHLTAIDGTKFDFMQVGTFNMLKTNGLQIHAFMDVCNLPGSANGTCTYGIGIGFGDAVARVSVGNNKAVVTKGTNDLTALRIGETKGETKGFRLFVTSDPTTFVDVMLGKFSRDNGAAGFLDLSISLSDKFRQDVSGLLSAGGKKSSEELVKEYKLSDDKSLLTCEQESCKGFIDGKALNSNDLNQGNTSLLSDGYVMKNAQAVPLQKFDVSKIHHNAVKSASASANSTANSTLDKNHVLELCTKVITSVTLCKEFVERQAFFIDEVCVKDTMASGVLDSIDHAKLAYMRQCRRQVDNVLLQQNGTAAASTAAETRKRLHLADAEKCPKSCSGRGKCLVNGCRCNKGWSGLGCEVALQ